jgi:hypothetical protein
MRRSTSRGMLAYQRSIIKAINFSDVTMGDGKTAVLVLGNDTWCGANTGGCSRVAPGNSLSDLQSLIPALASSSDANGHHAMKTARPCHTTCSRLP